MTNFLDQRASLCEQIELSLRPRWSEGAGRVQSVHTGEGYLGLFEVILTHLDAILEARDFQKTAASWDCAWLTAI